LPLMSTIPRRRQSMKLSIRNKIAIAFFSLVVLGGLIWVTSDYRNFVLSQKFHIIISKNQVMNNILEARRYEKNYFLYLNLDDLAQALSYVDRAREKLNDIIREYGKYTYTSAPELESSREKLKYYGNSLEKIREYHLAHPGELNPEAPARAFETRQMEIRDLGREITEHMERMATQERVGISNIIWHSRIYLLLGTLSAFILCLVVAIFLFYNVNRPLTYIARAIVKIAKGDYTRIPPRGTGDEFDDLVNSLNQMINELNKRSDQLVQSEKMASLGTLTSGVAHELNNPLNNISTSLQILLEEIDEGEREYKKTLLVESEKQVEKARDIVKSLLEFSRESTFRKEPANLKNLVEKTIVLLKSEIPGNVELHLSVPDDLNAVIDIHRIQQVLINLILNSIHAMENGGKLTIRAVAGENTGEIGIQVEDTGKGIPDENLNKIFDPFFTTKDVGEGSGLGLSVSHGIIEKHGGRVEVASEIGKGSTFGIYLPVDGDEPPFDN